MTGITTLFGKNGCGKSRLLRAWRDNSPKTSHYIVPERSGDLEFQPSFLRQQIDPDQRREISQHNFADNYRRHVITRIQAYFLARGSTRGDKVSGNPADLEGLVNLLLPDFSIIFSGTQYPPYNLIRVSTGNKIGNIHELSSGEAQLLTIALDLLTISAIWDLDNSGNRMALIDEPDAHIHPDLQVRFADFLVRVADKFNLQIVIATHSTTLLSALGQFGGNSASVIYLDRIKSNFKAAPFSKEARELAACLGGHALMGPLFGVPLLLVEGDDDYRIWSQVPRHHVTSFSVIPTNGEEIRQYQRSLETILGALREPANPAGYALLDGDKGLPQATAQHPQNHIKFIKLNCHEAENLYLCDEVLALLGTNWEGAAAAILARAGEFGAKGAQLATAPQWDRKSCDVHELIHEITRILDEKNVHWTMRVARAVGKDRPVGQLLDFLGADVVNALWGAAPPATAQNQLAAQ